MIFDYRPFITLDAEEAQLNEGGANQWDNCGAAVYALILKWLGYGDPYEPQQIMDLIHGTGWRGGEVSSNLITFVNRHYPNPPIIAIDRGDVVSLARAAAASRFPTCNWWWSNSNGDIQPRNTGILHWSTIVYDDGASLGVFNIMRGQLVALPYAAARAAYAGEFTTFHSPLGDNVTQDEFNVLVANNPFITDIAYRLDALLANKATVEGGMTAKGEANQLRAELAAIKAGGGSPAAGTISGTITGTITPK